MNWICCTFAALSVEQLYDAMKLRADVFVVEQNCVYPDLDNKDKHHDTLHLLGYENTEIVAYSRIVPPGLAYSNPSVGRVVTASAHRGNGLGKALLREAIIQCEHRWPNQCIDIGAQCYLHAFYSSFGFVSYSSSYLEDGIEHVNMRLTKSI